MELPHVTQIPCVKYVYHAYNKLLYFFKGCADPNYYGAGLIFKIAQAMGKLGLEQSVWCERVYRAYKKFP